MNEILLLDEKDDVTYFSEITYVDFRNYQFVIDWKNSGPFGPWSRDISGVYVYREGELPKTHLHNGKKYTFLGQYGYPERKFHLRENKTQKPIEVISTETTQILKND